MSKVPQLRFPEFSGEWEEKLLGNLGEFSKGADISKSDLTEQGQECVLYGELYTKYNEVISNVLSKTNSQSKRLVKGQSNDVLIPSSGETAIDIATASCLKVEDVLIGGDLNIFRPKEENGVFISYQLNNSRKHEIAKLAQGSSVVHLYNEQLKKLVVAIPTLDEQQKIADFFTLLDQKIEKQQQKIEHLEQYKKGIMQQLFSRTIRFKDENGNDYPDWEEKTVGDICKIATGKLDANAMNEGGKFPFYTCAKEVFRIDEFAFDTEALLISGNGANVGYIHYCIGKFNAYQRTYVLDRFVDEIQFVKFYLENFLPAQIMKEKNEGNTPYIVLGTLRGMKILLPDFKEQVKISSFFLCLDWKIKKESDQLSLLKAQKKGLIQKMFI